MQALRRPRDVLSSATATASTTAPMQMQQHAPRLPPRRQRAPFVVARRLIPATAALATPLPCAPAGTFKLNRTIGVRAFASAANNNNGSDASDAGGSGGGDKDSAYESRAALASSSAVAGVAASAASKPAAFGPPLSPLDSDDAGPAAAADAAGPPQPQPPPPFAALPSPANVGRKRKLALLALTAALEFAMTGGLFWAPLVGGLAAIASSPSGAQLRAREAEVAARAEERARAELLRRMPVSPAESAEWLNRLNWALWRPFVEPFLLRQCLAGWQETAANAAPRGWALSIADVSLGTEGANLSNFRAYADPETGRLAAIDCALSLDSDSLKVVVKGQSPIAAFTASVSGIRMRGDVRIIPIMDQRMLLWGFKSPPAVNVRLAVKGPGGAGADLSQFAFIQNIVSSTIQEMLVEPRRGAIALDHTLRIEEAVATTVSVRVEALAGLPRALGRRGAPARLAVVAVETVSRLRGATARPVELAPGARGADVNQRVRVELPRKEGMVRLELRDLAAGGRVLGSALLWVASSMDGTTLFWAHARDGEPLARRWGAADAPWRVALPLEGAAVGDMAELRVAVSVEPWLYKRPASQAAFRSAGPRTLLLQVVEARNLGGPAGARAAPPNPFVRLAYDQTAAATPAAFGTASPVLLESFAFAENPGPLTRRVRLEAWGAPGGGGGGSLNGGASRASRGRPGSALGGVGSSSGSGGGRNEFFGGTSINLDLVPEGAVSDRWYALGGGDGGGEVRVRAALVPGAPGDPGARGAADWAAGALAGAAREALLVEVLSSRLQLPLSSVDSDDTDSRPFFRLSLGGVSYISEPAAPGARRRAGSGSTGRITLRGRSNDSGNSSGSSSSSSSSSTSSSSGSAAAGSSGSSSGSGKSAATAPEDLLARAAFACAPSAGSGVGATLLVEVCDADAADGGGGGGPMDDAVVGAAAVDVSGRLSGGGSGADGRAAWEGWLRLDRDGGHVLMRLTRLAAAEPSDVVLPAPSPGAAPDLAAAAASTAAAAAASSTAAAADPAAAVAAAVATAAEQVTQAAASGGAKAEALAAASEAALLASLRDGGGISAVVGALGGGGTAAAEGAAWLDRLVDRVQAREEGLRGQAQATVNRWVQQASGWLNRGGGGGGAKGGSKGSSGAADASKAATAAGDARAGAGSDAGSSSGSGSGSSAIAPAAPAAPAFDVQQALMSALGGLGLDGGRFGARGGGDAQPSGWWDRVDAGRPAAAGSDGEKSGGPAAEESSSSSSAAAEAREAAAHEAPTTLANGAGPSSSSGSSSSAAAAAVAADRAALSHAMAAAAAAHARAAQQAQQTRGALLSHAVTLNDEAALPSSYALADADGESEGGGGGEHEDGEGEAVPTGNGSSDGSSSGSSAMYSSSKHASDVLSEGRID